MEPSAVAELQELLAGVPLPSERATLVRYALHQDARGEHVALLQRLPDRWFESLDEVTEELLRL